SLNAHSVSATRDCALERSHVWVISRGYRSRAARSASSRLPQMTTRLPALRKRAASASPTPDAPPVTRTVFDVRFIWTYYRTGGAGGVDRSGHGDWRGPSHHFRSRPIDQVLRKPSRLQGAPARRVNREARCGERGSAR